MGCVHPTCTSSPGVETPPASSIPATPDSLAPPWQGQAGDPGARDGLLTPAGDPAPRAGMKFSVASLAGNALDLAVITRRDREWIFPKWRVHRQCTVCECRNNLVLDEARRLQAALKTRDIQNTQQLQQVLMEDSSAMVLASLLAMNALDLTAPASDALLKNRKNTWVQLAGHQGSFAPAGPDTIWKRRLTKESNYETKAYQALMRDSVHNVVPRFYREVEYNGDHFIEMEDLLRHFKDPNIMDIKMGTRTFLESEVKNPALRKDLYEKMTKLNPDEPTAEEHRLKAVTKLRYMQFRERGSSTSTLGFRLEAIRMSGMPPNTDLKKVKTKEQVSESIAKFLCCNHRVKEGLIYRCREIAEQFSRSAYFKHHEIIGSSLLILYDKSDKVGAWMIDFAKTLAIEDRVLTHKDEWEVGNHEDGFLTGLTNLTDVLESMDFTNSSSAAPTETSSKNSVNSSSSLSNHCVSEDTPNS